MLKFLFIFKLLCYQANFIIIFFSILFGIVDSIYSSKELLTGGYPKAIVLSSGKYFIACSEGLFIYNWDFSLNKTVYNFTNINFNFNDNKDNTFIYEIIQNKIPYIFCLYKGKILVVIKNEEVIKKVPFDPGDKIYNTIPFKFDASLLQYIRISIIESHLYVKLYELNLSPNNGSNYLKCENKSNILLNSYDLISCQKMKYSLENEEILTCFFDHNGESLVAQSFNVKNNLNIIKEKYYYSLYLIFGEVINIQSSLLFDKSRCFICYIIFSGGTDYLSNCLIYDIEKDEFEKTGINLDNYNKLEIYSFYEANQYALLFYNEMEVIDDEFNLIFFDENITIIEVDSNNETKIFLQGSSATNIFL